MASMNEVMGLSDELVEDMLKVWPSTSPGTFQEEQRKWPTPLVLLPCHLRRNPLASLRLAHPHVFQEVRSAAVYRPKGEKT